MPTFILFLYFLFFLFSTIGLGAFILDRIRFPADNRVEFMTFAFGLGAALQGMVFVYLGMFHILYPSLVLLGYGAGAVLTAYGLTQTRWRKALQHTFESIPSVFTNVYAVSLILVVFFVFFPLIPHLFLQVISWDAAAYHLVLPKFYLQQHHLDFVGWLPHTAFPMAMHALFGFGEAIRDARLSNLITFSFTFASAVYILFGLRKRFPQIVLLGAFLIFFFQPQLYSEIGYSPNVDYGLAFYGILSMIALLKYSEKPQLNTAWVLFAVTFFAGFIKLTGMFLVGVVGLFFLGATILSFRKTKFSKIQNWIKQHWLATFAFLLVMIPCTYWYGKTWVQAGNPMYPFMNNIFKGFDYDPTAVDLLKDDINLLNAYVQPIILRYKTAVDTAADNARFSELVLLAFAFVTALFTLVFGKKDERLLTGVSLLVLVPVIYLVGPLLRYYMFAIPLLILAGVSMFYRLITTHKYRDTLVLPVILGLAVLLIFSIETTYLPRHELFLKIPKRMLLSYLDPKVAHDKLYLQDNYRTVEYANGHLDPKKHKVLLVGDNRMYYLNIPAEMAAPTLHGYFVDKTITTPEGVYKKMKDNNFTHAMITKNWGVPRNVQPQLFDDFIHSSFLEVMATASGHTLYRLK